MNGALQLLAVCSLSAAAAGGTFLVKGPPVRALACDPSTLKPDEICLFQVVEPVVWIDARERVRWQADGLPGSILWNPDKTENQLDFESAAAMKISETPGARVVVYCSTEACGVSRQIAGEVLKLGLASEVKVLRGGWDALNAAGRIKGSSAAR